MRKTIVIVAEGALDSRLQPIHANQVKDILSERLGLDTRVTTLGHTQRGGRPCAFDRILVSHRSLCGASPRLNISSVTAHPAGRRSRRSPARSHPRHPVLHDRDTGEQNHARSANGSRSTGARHMFHAVI